MNKTEVLEIIGSDQPTDEQMFAVIAWLKKRKPTSRDARKVVKRFIQHPRFESALPWLADWIRNSPWDELRMTAWNISSPVVYDWLVQVLTDNPTHPQSGDVWDAMLMSYRDHAMAVKASVWLTEHGIGDKFAPEVAARLLPIVPTDPVRRTALELLEKVPDNFNLLAAAIEHLGTNRSIELGLSYIKGAKRPVPSCWVAAALLRRDTQSFVSDVNEFLAKHWKDRHLYAAFEEMIPRAPQPVLVVLKKWIESYRHPETVSRLLEYALIVPSQEWLDYAWTWYEKSDWSLSSDFLQALLKAGKDLQLPNRVLEESKLWLEQNEGDSGWIWVAVDLVDHLDAGECAEFGLRIIHSVLPEDRGRLLAALVRKTPTEAVFEKAREWQSAFPKHKHNALIAAAFVGRGKYIEDAKTLLDANDDLDTARLLIALVKQSDEDSIAFAKQFLTKRFINFKFNDLFKLRGELIIALLSVPGPDGMVLQSAEDWLQYPPSHWDEKFHQQVRDAYKSAQQA